MLRFPRSAGIKEISPIRSSNGRTLCSGALAGTSGLLPVTAQVDGDALPVLRTAVAGWPT